ncbi:MAG: trehalose-6-phosphate synthase, partial [Hasllibacter sp.]
MSRLIVVSNRLPLGDDPSGGLVVAVREALKDGGVWVGNSGKPVEVVEEKLTDHPGAPFDRLSFDITHEEHENYYAGFANSVLWPLCHGRVDLMRMRPDYPSAYRRVNRRIARLIAGIVKDGDRIWVHDYHHLPLAYELRQLGVANPIAFFLHIPFPGPMAFQALPNAAETARWIAAFDMFGLQSKRDVASCLEAFRTVPDASILLNGNLALRGESVRVGAFPIGIDVDEFAATAAGAPPRARAGGAPGRGGAPRGDAQGPPPRGPAGRPPVVPR